MAVKTPSQAGLYCSAGQSRPGLSEEAARAATQTLMLESQPFLAMERTGRAGK